MIPLTRSTDLTQIPSIFFAGDKDEYELKLLNDTRAILKDSQNKRNWKGKWRAWGDISLKEILLKESFEKCAYCETRFRPGYYGDIEHYRPKSTYWWLAYCYHNYLYSCALCNQTHKRDKFIVEGTAWLPPLVTSTSTDLELRALIGTFSPEPGIDNREGSIYRQFLESDSAESFQLINPYIINPNGNFGYFFDDDAREVEIFVHPNAIDIRLVENTIEILGLNRKELLEERYYILYHYRKYREAHDQALTTGFDSLIQITEELLQLALGKKAQYSGMCNFFQKSFDLGDNFIYTPQDDNYLEEVSLAKIFIES